MTEEESILKELMERFPCVQGKIRIQRARRLFAEAPADKFAEVFSHAVNAMQFNMLTAITGMDGGANLVAMYHLTRPSGVVLNLSVAVPREKPVLQTVIHLFPAADCYERELVDLLGIQVEGLPPGSRYPLPDNWPAGQYPLRKDWKPEGQTTPAAGSVKTPAAAAQVPSPNVVPASKEVKNG